MSPAVEALLVLGRGGVVTDCAALMTLEAAGCVEGHRLTETGARVAVSLSNRLDAMVPINPAWSKDEKHDPPLSLAAQSLLKLKELHGDAP